MSGLEERLVRAAALLRAGRDVALERIPDEGAPSWAVARGWDDFLVGLPDEAVAACEKNAASAALALASAPRDLAALAREAAAIVAMPEFAVPGAAVPGSETSTNAQRPAPPITGASPSKSGQVAALVALCRERGFDPRRVVDVGSGAGHLTRALARALGVPALGFERNEERVASARARTEGDEARFEAVAVDASRVALERGDLAVGLHACGALGDTLVRVAARDQAHLVLVACCPQKIETRERVPVSVTGCEQALAFPREVLGLANAFEGTPDLDTRAVRVALRRLLRARGVTVRPGEESQGLTPRVRRRLPAAAERALAQRGLEAASDSEQAEAMAAARAGLSLSRRRTLPRRLVANVLEVALALDRARALEEAGAAAEVLRIFPRALSPRNLAVVARAPS